MACLYHFCSVTSAKKIAAEISTAILGLLRAAARDQLELTNEAVEMMLSIAISLLNSEVVRDYVLAQSLMHALIKRQAGTGDARGLLRQASVTGVAELECFAQVPPTCGFHGVRPALDADVGFGCTPSDEVPASRSKVSWQELLLRQPLAVQARLHREVAGSKGTEISGECSLRKLLLRGSTLPAKTSDECLQIFAILSAVYRGGSEIVCGELTVACLVLILLRACARAATGERQERTTTDAAVEAWFQVHVYLPNGAAGLCDCADGGTWVLKMNSRPREQAAAYLSKYCDTEQAVLDGSTPLIHCRVASWSVCFDHQVA
eukprot:855867-Pleurochrysis_carterae.AAC.1